MLGLASPAFNEAGRSCQSSYLLAAEESERGIATCVTNHIAPFREHGLTSRAKNSAEISDGAVRIVGSVTDVEPLKLAHVRDRVELSVAAGSGDWGGNHALQHISVEHEGVFVRSSKVVRIDVPTAGTGIKGASSATNVMRNTDPGTATPVPTRCKVVNEVVEALVGALNAKRSEELANLGAVAVVFANSGVLKNEAVALLRASDDGELRTAILAAERIVASTIANEAHIQTIKDALSQTARGRSNRNVGEVAASAEHQLSRRRHSNREHFVLSQTAVFATIALNPSIACILSEDTEDVGELLFALHSEAKVVYANLRRLDSSLLKVEVTKGLSELNYSGRRNAVRARASIETYIRPRLSCSRKRTLIGHHGNGSAHLIRPCSFFAKLKPR